MKELNFEEAAAEARADHTFTFESNPVGYGGYSDEPDYEPDVVDDSTPCPSCGRDDCDSPYLTGCGNGVYTPDLDPAVASEAQALQRSCDRWGR